MILAFTCRSYEKEKDKSKLKLSVKRKLETTVIGPDGQPVKKKDGRGRPRKDKTLEAQQAAAQAAAAALAAANTSLLVRC